MKWTIASRKSALAICQAKTVARRLSQFGICARIIGLSTAGDETADKPLADIGGKELFIKNLQTALREKKADIAVHSLKDMAATGDKEFALAAVGFAEDARDVLVSNLIAKELPPQSPLNKTVQDSDSPPSDIFAALPNDAIIGTASPRRAALLKHYHPRLRVRPIRGNLQSRLTKLDDGDYDALILAAAGLHRLGLQKRIAAYLSPSQFIPAAGQGLLAVECLSDNQNAVKILGKINEQNAMTRAVAERAFCAAMNGDCQTPMGAHAVVEKKRVRLIAFYAAKNGDCFFVDAEAKTENAAAAGKTAADKIAAKCLTQS